MWFFTPAAAVVILKPYGGRLVSERVAVQVQVVVLWFRVVERFAPASRGVETKFVFCVFVVRGVLLQRCLT
jgi:hypothetical protein